MRDRKRRGTGWVDRGMEELAAVLWLAAVVLAILLGLRGAAGALQPRTRLRHSGSAVVVVRGGDSLWAIARRHCPASEDPRRVVHALRAANHLSSGRALQPGQRLLVPAFERPRQVSTETVVALRN